jgi:hypothetical protein
MNTYIKEMILALSANIEYLRKEGSEQLKIKNGELLNSVGDIYIYEFRLTFFQDIEPGANIGVRVRNENANGNVLAINEKSIQIELDKNIGSSIPEALLIISSHYLLELLYEKLKKVESGELRFTDLAEKVFKLKPAQIAFHDYQIPASSISELPDPTQEKAIKLALGSEISFIWGPPGTGKTRTIARVIEGFLAENKSVLLIAHTNVATDGALLNVVKHLENTDDYRDGKLLREGSIQKPELKSYEMVVPKNVLEKKALPIKKEIEALVRQISSISLMSSQSETIIRKFREIESSGKEKENIKGALQSKQAEITLSQETLKKIETQLLDVEEKIKNYKPPKGIFNHLLLGFGLYGPTLEILTPQKSTLLIQKERESEKISTNLHTIDIGKTKLQVLTERSVQLEEELRDQNLAHHQKIVEQSSSETKNLKLQSDLLTKQLGELVNVLIKEAKVIATTLTKSYTSKVILNREYDCVVVDEASMAPLPAIWCAAGLAKQKVVIVGDFYQLSPIAKHKVLNRDKKSDEEIKREEGLVENWLKRDIYAVWGILSVIRSGNKPDLSGAVKDSISDASQHCWGYQCIGVWQRWKKI